MDNINSLLKNASQIDLNGFSLKLNLKDNDIVHVWDEVSAYIDRHMSQSKGVSIPGFGTFSFVQKKLDIGNSKYVLIQRPVFQISEKFAQTHGLNYTKYTVAGNIPVHPLNYSAIANETAFSRDDIETCVKHVLQIFNRSVQANKNIEFTFTGIGKLQIRNSKVKMKFFKQFVNSCDSTGKALNDMQNRPHTADSVMSRNDMSRNQSRNTCILPRLNSRIGAANPADPNNNPATMDTINEENNEIEHAKHNETFQVPIATLFSADEASSYLENDNVLVRNQPVENVNTSLIVDSFTAPSSSAIMFTKNEAEMVNSILNSDPLPKVSKPNISSETSNYQLLARPSSKTLIGSLVGKSNSLSSGGGGGSSNQCSHHHSAGQELCYLCHQRERRNIPVYLNEEVKQKEKEESQILAQYQHLKDLEKQLKDEEKRNNQRLDRARMDAFNLGISEAVKMKKKERPKTSDISRSFIFRKRCKTPPKLYKQQDLGDYLLRQMDSKQKELNQFKQEIDYQEKMERMQLAEELAAQREAYIREKLQRQKDLKSALDYQVRTKPIELPKTLPDTEVFGLHDAKNEKLSEARNREIEAFKYNKEKSEQRKREELLSQLNEQEVDAENVERVKEEYRYDRDNRFKRLIDMRKSLEVNWKYADQDKKLRDLDERQHRYAHDGLLVHEQCDKYKRCAQCQRDLKNCGESNVWKETRYTAGTRIVS